MSEQSRNENVPAPIRRDWINLAVLSVGRGQAHPPKFRPHPREAADTLPRFYIGSQTSPIPMDNRPAGTYSR